MQLIIGTLHCYQYRPFTLRAKRKTRAYARRYARVCA